MNRAEAEQYGHPYWELAVFGEPSECEVDEGDVEPAQKERQEELVRRYATNSDKRQKKYCRHRRIYEIGLAPALDELLEIKRGAFYIQPSCKIASARYSK
ncbi:MAG: hypothetical protein R3B51_12565 [Thermodesulfobacteriota bacterium]